MRVRAGRRGEALLVAVIVCVVPMGAAAQPVSAATNASPATRAAAAAEFQHGVALLDARSFDEAAAAFERSLALRESVSALYDLGLARRGAGDVLAALRAFQRVVALAPEESASRRAALVVLGELRPLVAHAHVVAAGGPSALLVDGAAVTATEGVADVDVLPGAHTFAAQRASGSTVSAERTLAAGDVVEVSLDATEPPPPTVPLVVAPVPASVAPALVAATPPADARVSPTRSPSLVRDRRFWIAVGAGTALVAGSIVLGVVLAGTRSSAPYDGGSWGTVVQGVGIDP